jgi:hypothetical protein
MPETRSQKEERIRAVGTRRIRAKLHSRYTDIMLTKIESTMWSDAQEESEEGKAAAADAIAANSTPPAVRDPLQIYNDASTIEYRMILALRKIEPHPDNVTKPHGKRSSSQGRKTTRGVGECDDSHNEVRISNRALFYIVFALVLYAMYVSPAGATVKL